MDEILKRLRSKTYILAIASSAIGLLQAYPAVVSGLLPQLTAQQMGWVMMGIGVVGAVIRELTTKPLSEK